MITVASFCFISPVIGQNQTEAKARVDSLLKLAEGRKDDSGKVKLLNDVANEFNKISPYDGIRYARRSLSIAEALHWKPGIARSNSALGANYFSLSDYPDAYKYWLVALNLNKDLGNQTGIANHMHNIGNIFVSQKNYDKALEYYSEALKISEEAGNKKTVSYAYTSIGNVYILLKDYDKALDYHLKALEVDKELNQNNNIASDQVNIASVYNEQGQWQKSLEILRQALETKKETGDINGIAKAYNLIGKVYLDMAGFPGTDTRKPDERPTDVNKTKYLHLAVTYLDSALVTDAQIGYLDNMQKSYEFLSEAQEKLNNQAKALESYKQYTNIKDSIYSSQKQAEIFNLEKKEEIEEKNREMEKEEEEKQRVEYLHIGGITLFILALISSFLLLRKKRINPKFIDMLGTFSVVAGFEFIELLLHGKIEEFTHHNLTFTLCCLLLMAALIIPTHHKIDHWMKKQIGKKEK